LFSAEKDLIVHVSTSTDRMLVSDCDVVRTNFVVTVAFYRLFFLGGADDLQA
jgi:hypothetical protein